MTEFNDFYQLIAKTPLAPWLDTLPAKLNDWRLSISENTSAKAWLSAVEGLPELHPSRLDLLHTLRADMLPPLSDALRTDIENRLKALIPWRKGPFFYMA